MLTAQPSANSPPKLVVQSLQLFLIIMFARFQLTAVILAAVLVAVNAQADCARNYTVSLGDTCDGISAAQNVSTYQLATVNAAVIDAACDNLFVGEDLCLGITGQDCTVVHVVQSGDFCASIAEAADIDLSTLLANNPNVDTDCTNIYLGEVLCTADEVI
ncbi:hypothetical protein A0H81_01620 [Grifola frondosa]|uniref:LysM domain-containing protein n=1 Tax=Grifola frondosa TaxID=5627 RepID=A0A1C7MJY3_GRIFR|nr:hypothetical protein A0H81_01620 [Grifola frondosa]